MTDPFGRPPSAANSSPRAAPSSRDTGSIPAGERRVITVLFCDVVGSTALAGRLDPEEWAEVMNEAFRYMIAPVEEYGGMVARLMGDAVLAFFGAPQAHEDDPQRAILAGLGIVNGMRPFIHQFEQDYGLAFNVRVGINTGPVVVGEMGMGQMGEYTAMGDAINLAARMEQTAAPGTVQISDDTYRHVAPLFDVWDLGGIPVKGKDEPVHAYRVLGLEMQPGRLRGLEGIHAPLVGRDRELARLGDILTALRDGQSRIVYLIGEAGLGKSRLIAEARQMWRAQLAATNGAADPLWRGWTEFVAVSFGASRPYDLLKRQVRHFCNIRETDTPIVVHERLRALVDAYPSALHAPMHRVFGFLLGDGSGEEFRADGEGFQRELRAVLLQMAQVQVAQGPVVYIIDDVHWADVASLEALRSLLPLATRRPVLFLFAMRPDWNTPGWQMYMETQLAYSEYCASVYLEPLGAGESKTLVGALLGAAEVPDAVCDLIQRKAEGNPFFLEETVRALLDSGALRREDDRLQWDAGADLEKVSALIGLPGNVQALLTARIDQLAPEVRRTLQLASVIGRSFAFRVLERIAEKPGETLAEHLKRLGQADLVRPMGGGAADDYAFRHALTRDAVYETILLRQRRRYHRRVGEAIEALYADRLTDEAPRLAYHFAECRDWPRAVRYHVMAAEAAARLYANTEAIEHYDRALEICRDHSETADDAQLAALYRRRGRVYEVAGRHEDALRSYEEMEKLGRERHSATLELESLTPRALLYLTPTPYENGDRGRELAARILALAEQAGRPDAEAYGRWAMLLFHVNFDADFARAVAEGERALALARQHGLAELEAYVLNDMGRTYTAAHRMTDALAALAAAFESWRVLGNEPMQADAASIWSQWLLLRGDLAEAERLAREGLAIGRRINNVWAQSFNALSLGQVLFRQGHAGEALRLTRWAMEISAQGGFSGPAVNAPLLVYWVTGLLGQPAVAREQLRDTLAGTSLADHPFMGPLAKGMERYFTGDAAAGFALSAKLAWPGVARLGPIGIMLYMMPIEMGVAAGRADEALAMADDLLETLSRDGFAAFQPDALALRGAALRRLGRAGEARAAYAQALDEATRLGVRWPEWTILAALSELEPEPERAAGMRRRAAAAADFLAGQIDDDALRAAFLARDEVRRLRGDG